MKMNWIRTPIVLFTLYCVLIVGIAATSTGCPKKDALRAAADASYRLPAATNDIIEQVATARDTGLISIETAAQFGKHLNDMARAEVVFVGMVRAAVAANSGNVNADAKSAATAELRKYFDLNIVGPFLNTLELVRLLTADQKQLIMLAITAAKLLIRTIAGGLGSANYNRLAGPAGPGFNFKSEVFA